MVRRRRTATRCILAIIALAAAGPARAAPPGPSTPPLAANVPDDALAFFAWQGADALQPAYANSHLKTFLDASKIPAFLATNLPRLLGQQSGDPAAVTFALDQLQLLWRHPAAVYIAPLELAAKGRPPSFRAAFLCRAGADTADEAAALAKLIPPAEGPFKVSLASNDSLLVIAVNLDAHALLEPQKSPLATAPRFVAAINGHKPFSAATPALSAYLNIHGLLANIDQVLADPSVPADARATAAVLVDALGIRTVSSLSLAAGFDGPNWTQSSFLAVPPGPRAGLLRLADPRPLDPAAFRLIPRDAVSASLSTIDLDGLFNDLRDTLPRIDPAATPAFDQALNQFRQQFGIDLQRDLLATLDGLIVTYRAGPDAPFVAAIKLKDPQKFAATLATLTAKANAANFPYKIEQAPGAHGTVSILHIPQIPLAWTIDKDTLYISSVHGLDAALDFADASPPQPALPDNPAFAALRKSFSDKLTALSYADPAALYPEAYQAAQLLFLLGAGRLGIELPSDLLPAPEAAAPAFTPTIAATWSDADGIHTASRAAFPGAELLGTEQASSTVAVAAMGAAILLPSLARARELSSRSVTVANERGIAQSCVIYAVEHDDHFPDDLSAIVLDGQISPKSLISRRSHTDPLELSDADLQKAKADPAAFAKTLSDHSDFVYLGKGAVNDSDSSLILLYEKPSADTTDGISLAFHDGHAEFIRWAGLADAFKATNDYRKAHHLGPVDMDALLPPGRRPAAKPSPAIP